MAVIAVARLSSAPATLENSQQIANEQDHQNCAESDASASAVAPAAVSVISSAASEEQQQNDNEYEHEEPLSLQM
jgi:hypothetical protein